ncbi:LysR family transcriptional regulator [Morganella morganii]|nr:LysR family transcriptional regulator [Morganella morganii]TPW54687.1 LysR family transcriptional regulator [Morganella morganii]
MKEKNYFMNRYPPMKALLAFEASVRLGSFIRAAEFLHVTPGAVSQQIKKLEDELGVMLFVREIRKLTVTETGQKYYRLIQPALEQIRAAGETIRYAARHTLTLSMPPGLASKWFSPRMSDFVRTFPGLDLHLNATAALVSLEKDNVDLAVRYTDLSRTQPARVLLSDAPCRLFCHPAYAARLSLHSPADLKNAVLLHTTLYPYWDSWLEHYAGIASGGTPFTAGLHFDQFLLAIDAAVHQQGILIANDFLLEHELAQQTLIPLFPELTLHSGKGFYLLHNRHSADQAMISAVSDWFCHAFAHTAENT